MKPSVFRGALYHHLRSRRLLKAAEVINDEATSAQYTFEVCGGLEECFTVEDLETEFTLTIAAGTFLIEKVPNNATECA